MSPFFLLLYLKHDSFDINWVALPYVLIFLLGISELSDALDGYFARRFNEVTALGKILDPMADSIYRISIFLTFTLPPVELPMILIFAFLYRDSIISTLRTLCALNGYALAARPSGKLKAIIQALSAFAILLLLIPYSSGNLSQETLHFTSTIIVGTTALYTLLSGADYIYANRHYILKMLTKKNESLAIPNEIEKLEF